AVLMGVAEQWRRHASEDKKARSSPDGRDAATALADPLCSFEELVALVGQQASTFDGVYTIRLPQKLVELLRLFEYCYRYALVHKSEASVEIKFDRHGQWSVGKLNPPDPLLDCMVKGKEHARAMVLSWLQRIAGHEYAGISPKEYCQSCGLRLTQPESNEYGETPTSTKRYCERRGCSSAALRDWIENLKPDWPDHQLLAAKFAKRLSRSD
ncbi:MAG: hypothetical protein ACRD3W_19415, partial [Terriglobales bacterium]